MRFTRTSCNASGVSITPPFCYIKAVSRTVTTLNFGFNTTRDLNFFIKHHVDYQYGTIYRRIFDFKPFDWCSFMDGSAKNHFFTVSIAIVAKTAQHLLHPCPYKGEVKGLNITYDTGKFGAVYPQGKYRNFWRLSDDVDPNIMTYTYDVEVRSPIKSSFG
ncbi:unnamed protein product [Diamesa serratosioi]